MSSLKLVVLLVSLVLMQMNLGLAKNGTFSLTFKKTKETTKKSGALQAASAGTITSAYIATITLGPDTTQFNLLIDTGKTATWVVDRYCPDAFCQQSDDARKFYESAKSRTYSSNGKSVGVSYFYKEYQASGPASKDKFTFVGATPDLTIDNQDFIRATSTKKFTTEQYDGFLGLAYNPVKKSDTRPTVFENMLTANLITSKIFSIKINADGTGKLLLGEALPADYTAPLNYVAVVNKGLWDFKASLVTLGAVILEKNGAKFRIETILPNIGAPTGQLKNIAKYFGGTLNPATKKYTVSCGFLAADPAPILVLTINGIQYEIPSTTLISDDGSGTLSACTLNLSDTKTEWILGQTFLALYYTAYDGTKHQVGFATYA